MSEVHVIFGYRIFEEIERISPELNEYARELRAQGSKIEIYDDLGIVYIGIPMYSKSAPEDSFDWENINCADALEIPGEFHLPYSLSKIAEKKSPQIFVVWDLTY